MQDAIIAYFSRYMTLTEEEVQLILDNIVFKSFSKGTILLREGELAKECYLVLKGCVRSYYLLDGEEKTTAFFTENHPITPISYIQQTPSDYYISCEEDCVLSVGTPEKTAEAFHRYPRLLTMAQAINEELLINQQLQLDNQIKLSPEQRYLKLLEERSDLFHRVPQYQIASYLGITAVSLSRIRKRIHERRRS